MKKIFLIAAVFAAFLLNFTNAAAQTTADKQSEPSFDVILQTVIASNNAGAKSDVSQTLSGIVKKLKSDFLFSSYRLNSTYMQKVSNKGTFEVKNVDYGQDDIQGKNPPTFSEWRLAGLQMLLDEKGQETIYVQNFKFGQRIPLATSNITAENGKTSSVITYEQVGLSTSFSVSKNAPTVVGSVATSKPDELMFLILTVKSAEK